jgi:hypothetical protein
MSGLHGPGRPQVAFAVNQRPAGPGVARYRAGGKLPAGIPETARGQLAATLRRDADGLIAITTTG